MARSRKAGNTAVGLDIEPGYVAAVEARVNGSIAVERAAGAVLPPGVVRDGEVADVEALGEALHALFREHKLGSRVRVGVANQSIVMRTLDLPPLTDPKEIAAAVRFQAADQIPMPIEQVVLEHQSLGQIPTPDGVRTRVVLVAARRDMIDRLLGAVRHAGLRAEGIDLSAFAMIRALAVPNAPADDPAVLYLSVAGVTNLAVAEGPVCTFTRVIATGLETLAGELAERRGLTLVHAHEWLRHVGLSAEIAEVDGDAEIVTEARRVLLDGVRRIGDEVRNTLDFHHAQPGAASVERVVLTGAAAAVPGFDDGLAALLGLPVTAGVARSARPDAFSQVDAARLAVATGLTVAQVGA
jgi:type IV pilus assembly protein PilM